MVYLVLLGCCLPWKLLVYSIPDGHTKLYLPEYVIQYKYLFNTINQEMKIAEVSKLDKILNWLDMSEDLYFNNYMSLCHSLVWVRDWVNSQSACQILDILIFSVFPYFIQTGKKVYSLLLLDESKFGHFKFFKQKMRDFILINIT